MMWRFVGRRWGSDNWVVGSSLLARGFWLRVHSRMLFVFGVWFYKPTANSVRRETLNQERRTKHHRLKTLVLWPTIAARRTFAVPTAQKRIFKV